MELTLTSWKPAASAEERTGASSTRLATSGHLHTAIAIQLRRLRRYSIQSDITGGSLCLKCARARTDIAGVRLWERSTNCRSDFSDRHVARLLGLVWGNAADRTASALDLCATCDNPFKVSVICAGLLFPQSKSVTN